MHVTSSTGAPTRRWPALWALVVGFFMILVDSTIVSVAIPAIMTDLDAGITEVVWVTSAYLLAYAVPLLITGRLGDRIGPKPVYLAGLTLFTIASLLCGLSGSIGALIAWRVLQGLGASLMTPQTMAVIMRTFPPNERGAAMGLWGGVAGLAMLVGPMLGGLLVDAAGWAWIFYVNVPVGIMAFALVLWLVPRLETHAHSFDWVGVLLSTVALLCIVFGIQEGQTHDWDVVTIDLGSVHVAISIVALIVVGLLLLAVFVWWQSVTRREPLVPLRMLRDRGLALASVAIATVGFAVTAMSVPLFLHAQGVAGLTPTQSALLMVPMAVASGVLSPVAGRFLQARDARRWIAGGVLGMAVSIAWFGAWTWMRVDVWWLLAPSLLMGVASSFVWGPLGVTATRDLDPRLAGAGSGVYNAVRQMGAVLGSAAIAAIMSARVEAEVSAGAAEQATGVAAQRIPAEIASPFAAAMGQSLLLPACVLLVGLVAVSCLRPPRLATAVLPTTAQR